MKKTILAIFATSLQLYSTSSLCGSLLNVTVHQSLAEKLIRIPVDETRPVTHTTPDGVNVQGTARVQGVVKGKLKSEQGGAGLLLQMDTQTFTSSRQSTWPRRNIHISFDWDITTDTTTYKRLAMRTGGISAGAALAHSQSFIQYGQINAYANGLFPRITSNIALRAAQREIYGRHGQSVYDANQSVGAQLAASLDQQVEVMLAPVKESFARFVEGPFIKRKLLGGFVAFGGDDNLAQIRVDEFSPEQGAIVNPLLVTEAEPVALEIRPKALETFLAKTFGGAEFTEIEVIEMLFDQSLPINSPEDIHQKADELLVHFAEATPITFDFKANEIIVTIHAQNIETLGRSWEHVNITRDLKIKHDGGKIFLSFMDPWVISSRHGAVMDPVYVKHMISRLDEILPPGEIDISGLEISKGLPLKVQLAALDARVDSLVARLAVSGK